MTMMTCPKCGFEQPTDQFCAKCGVNVDTFKPTIAIGSGLKSLFKPVIILAILIGGFFWLFRTIEKSTNITSQEVDIEEATQIGSGASSLKMANRPPSPRALRVEPTQRTQVAARTVVEPKAAAEPAVAKFEQVQLSFAVGEQAGLDQLEDNKPNQTWHVVPQASPNFSSNPEEVTLKVGNNTFEYAEDLIAYDMNFFVEEITEKDVKLKLNMKRTLRARTQDGQNSYSFSLNERIPLDQTLIIIDALPRRASIDRPNSILSTLYKSELFLSRASEFVQIIKFENPSNSPQE